MICKVSELHHAAGLNHLASAPEMTTYQTKISVPEARLSLKRAVP